MPLLCFASSRRHGAFFESEKPGKKLLQCLNPGPHSDAQPRNKSPFFSGASTDAGDWVSLGQMQSNIKLLC